MTDTLADTQTTVDTTEPKHVLCEMNGHGDTRVMWDSDNADEVQAAREMFNSLKAKGHLAYSTNAKGERAEVIHRFDPDAERIIMTPQLVGG